MFGAIEGEEAIGFPVPGSENYVDVSFFYTFLLKPGILCVCCIAELSHSRATSSLVTGHLLTM